MATPIAQAQAHVSIMGTGAQNAPAHMPRPTASASQKKRVLVVDDDLDGAVMLSLLLRMLGYDVVTTDNGSDALGWGERLYPEVVLLDLAMPGMDGFALCSALRKLDWGARAKVIAVTGLDDVSDRERSQAAGFDVHLVKPVDPQVLYRELHSAPSFQVTLIAAPCSGGPASDGGNSRENGE